MAKGPGFDAIERLPGLNEPGRPILVEVVLLWRNAPDISLRAFAAIANHGSAIATCSFTKGRPIAPLLAAWSIDLFLSNHAGDVEAAADIAAAAFAPGRGLSEGRELRRTAHRV